MVAMIIWGLVAIAFGVIEGLTVGLVSIWFSIGSIGGLVAAALGAGFTGQFLSFVALSLISIIALRPLAKRYLVKTKTDTNADRIVGAAGLVVEPICNIRNEGRIEVLGQNWRAISEGVSEIPAGEQVEVLRIEGAKVVVTATPHRKDG